MKRFLWLCILALLAAAAWWGMKRDKGGEARAMYASLPVTRGDISVTIQATGVIRPQNRLEIKPSVAGRIEEVLVREGDEVKAGQTVAWMSSTDRAALLDAARARGPEELKRWQEIYKATPLIAPLDGKIIDRAMEPGQTATLADPVLVMSDRLIVEGQVDETDLAKIRTGQEALVTLDAYPDQSFPAKVTHIAHEAETVENVTIYKVEVLPTEMPEFVRSGMTANVTFTSVAASQVLVVPAEAVKDEAGKQVVMRPAKNGGEPRPHDVLTGLSDGRNIEIKEGLAEGDLISVPQVQTPFSDAPQKSNPFMPFGRRGTGRAGR